MKTTTNSRLWAMLFGVLAAALLLGLLIPAIGKTKARSERKECIKNLQSLALAWSMYLEQYSGVVPASLLSISNVVTNPKLFVCPGDKSRNAVDTWAELLVRESSYRSGVLGNENIPPGQLPSSILLFCSFHGNVALADGSAAMLSPRDRTNCFKQTPSNR